MALKLSDHIPNWILMVISIVSILVALTTGYVSMQAQLKYQILPSMVKQGDQIAVLDKRITLVQEQQIRDRVNFEHMNLGISALSKNVQETNKLNRDLIVKIHKFGESK